MLLEKDDTNDGNYLDFIITVDIFNAGIDIPSINQAIFLRPTTSSIIFIQQLGRGLRKDERKDFVVIIDFIGNYESNFMIAKAFAFDGDKETGRIRLINGGDLPGISTIEFDEIARSGILKSLAKVSFNSTKELLDVFIRLANKLYRRPNYEDFENFSAFDPMRIISSKGSYYVFMKSIEGKLPSFISPLLALGAYEQKLLVDVGRRLGAGIRLEEPLLLLTLVEGGDYPLFLRKLHQYGLEMNADKERCIRKILTGTWGGEKKKELPFVESDFSLTKEFRAALRNEFFNEELSDLLKFFIHRYEKKFTNKYKGTDLCLNAQYSYRDVCQLFNYSRDLASVIGGYKYNKELGLFPIFVNYNKSTDLDESTKYDDYFINQRIFAWESKKGRNESSPELAPIYEEKTKLYLFVRKSKLDKESDAKKFYFLEGMRLIEKLKTVKKPTGEKGKVISYADGKFVLENEVRNDIYEYLQADLEEKK